MWGFAWFDATQPAYAMSDPRQLPSTAWKVAIGETSLVLEGNGVQLCELYWLSLGPESRLWPILSINRDVAIEFEQYVFCQSRPKSSYFLEADY